MPNDGVICQGPVAIAIGPGIVDTALKPPLNDISDVSKNNPIGIFDGKVSNSWSHKDAEEEA
ncbi:hypothetical protein [Pseudomonas sp. GL-RE-26]|uniref:hypothetical protein n=1 Tax=Pseudomonas sp. GL-RE-26 TaxID=2832390 RepID=UPI001CBF3C7F|nr:hypothetical protein [Pseudomonas sp. GL-RE-26]